MKGLVGTKVGMTQIFDENGVVIPVTVIQINENVVTQIKTTDIDGYNAIQIGHGEKRSKNINKPFKGHLDKAGVALKRGLQEFRVESTEGFTAGQELKADLFNVGDKIDITGITKGKGFQGNIKRHNHRSGPATHGSRHHRTPGAMSAAAYPGKVWKGKKLPGQMGNVTATIQNLEVVQVDAERNLLVIKGAVPGPRKGRVTIKETTKNK